MDSESTEIDTLLLHIATALVTSMDQLLNLLPMAAPIRVRSTAAAKIKDSWLEDITIRRALNEVLEYHWVHWPKNSTKKIWAKIEGVEGK